MFCWSRSPRRFESRKCLLDGLVGHVADAAAGHDVGSDSELVDLIEFARIAPAYRERKSLDIYPGECSVQANLRRLARVQKWLKIDTLAAY